MGLSLDVVSMQVLGLSLLIPLAAGSAQQYGGYGGYGYEPKYEHPKHNCSVTDVVEKAEVCTPALKTKCSSVELEIKRVLDTEQCYTVTRTVCSVSTETIDNQCKTQMVTVCQPAQYGYGHAYGEHAYGENLCKEVAQETCHNVPEVEDDVEAVDKCVTVLADPDCQAVELTLPKQSCVELVYGYAETAHHNEAPAPPPY